MNSKNPEEQLNTDAFGVAVKKRSDKLMDYFLISFFLAGLIFATFYDTWLIAFGVGGLCLFAYYLCKIGLPDSDLYQYLLSIILGVFMAQYIYQMHGMLEMHFFAFIGSAILITYQNWKLQIPIMLVVVIHHATFSYLQNIGTEKVYFTQLDDFDLQTFTIHVLLAAVIFFICGLWGYQLKKYNKKYIDQSLQMGLLQKQVSINLERKQNAEAVRESKQRLRQIIDLVPHFIFAKDAKGKFVLVNEAVAEAYGSTVENLIGKSDADFNSNKKEVEHFLQEDLKVINSGNTKYNIEETITDTKGHIRVLSTTKIPYTYAGDNMSGVLGVSVDISERKKAEIILKESQNQLTIATQIAKLGYWEFDVTKNLFSFNNQFYSIFRTTAEQVGGYIMSSERYVSLFVHPGDIQLVAKEGADAIKSPDPNYNRQIEHSIKYADGGIGYVSACFFIVKNEQGRTIKVFGAVQDITERKKAEETILKSEASLSLINKELELKNKELEHFAFVASHDLQEPLRTTSSFINLLQQQYKGKLDEKADKYLHYIIDSTDRMKILITDLLDYSRIGNKKELKQVDCTTVLNEVLLDLGTTIKETCAEIKVDALPVISGYQTEIKQLFQNLVVNAIKFRKKGTTPQISISAQKDSGCWKFAIRDNGIGIGEDHIDRIFVIFQRLHTRTEYEGSGIGLAHCKKIVGIHHGNIWVESKPGEGATFYFTIP